MAKSWSFYQNQYMEKRLGKNWATSGTAITTDGFAEQTAFLSYVYATVRWGWDQLFR